MTDLEHDRFLELLHEDFRIAKKVFDQASQRFDEISLHPSSDAPRRAKNASRKLDSAREQFTNALTRLNLFVNEGRVPDEL